MPTDDLFYIEYGDSRQDETQNSDVLSVGCFNYEYHKSMFRFNLVEKPINWTMCMIQIYIFNVVETEIMPFYSYGLHLDYNSWNENMSYTEFIATWGDWSHTVVFNDSLSKMFDVKIGFLKINITNYIENHETISMRLKTTYPDNFNYHTYSYCEIYSKEVNMDNKYKPQLIWIK